MRRGEEKTAEPTRGYCPHSSAEVAPEAFWALNLEGGAGRSRIGGGSAPLNAAHIRGGCETPRSLLNKASSKCRERVAWAATPGLGCALPVKSKPAPRRFGRASREERPECAKHRASVIICASSWTTVPTAPASAAGLPGGRGAAASGNGLPVPSCGHAISCASGTGSPRPRPRSTRSSRAGPDQALKLSFPIVWT